MGDGFLGWAANIICIIWTLFVCVIFSLPTILPVTKENMNYASVSGSSATEVINWRLTTRMSGHYRRSDHSLWVCPYSFFDATSLTVAMCSQRLVHARVRSSLDHYFSDTLT